MRIQLSGLFRGALLKKGSAAESLRTRRERNRPHGIAPDTPAIAVACATRPDEQVINATIATIAEKLAEVAPTGPVIVMLKQKVRLRSDLLIRSKSSFAALRSEAGLPRRKCRPWPIYNHLCEWLIYQA